MSFKDKLIKDIINPVTSQIFTNSIGKIISYDEVLNKANVLVSSSGSYTTLEDVPVQLSGKGVFSSKLKRDDLVYIQYNNGSVFQPKIIGFADEDYSNNTRESSKHLRKGSLVDTIQEKEGEVISRANRRIDSDTTPYKHEEYKEASALDIISQKTESLGYFNDGEIGLFHPDVSSLVKLKDNGDIDIFTGTNIGIRINKQKKTIEMFGDSSTISDNWKVLSNNVTVISENDIDINCKRLNIKSSEIYINEERVDV